MSKNTGISVKETEVDTTHPFPVTVISGGGGGTGQPSIVQLAAGNNNVGDVDVASIAIPATFYYGQKTVTTAGTELVLASTQVLLSGVTVKALHGNTGWIYVGKSGVSSADGFVLDAGESVFIETDNLADVFIDSSVNGEGVSYIGS